MSSLNQKEWYMSKRFMELNKRNRPGLRPLANSTLSLWGICGMSVPRMDAVASIIRSTIVSLTELKKLQMAFGFVFALDFDITDWGSSTISFHCFDFIRIICMCLVCRRLA